MSRTWTVERAINVDLWVIVQGVATIATVKTKDLADRIVEAHNGTLLASDEASAQISTFPASQHYVVVADDYAQPRDGWLDFHSRLSGMPFDDEYQHAQGPLVWEQYLGPGSTLEGARAAAQRMRGFGRNGVRIARLEFLPEGA